MTGVLFSIYECDVVRNVKGTRLPFGAEIGFHDSLGSTESLSEIRSAASTICQDGVKKLIGGACKIVRKTRRHCVIEQD